MPSENQTNLAWRHAYTILNLPEPPTTFELSGTDLSFADLQLFRENNLIEKANGSTERPHEWRVRPNVYETANEYANNTESFACCGEGRGVSNVGGELKCSNCGATVPSSEFNRVFNS